MPVLPIHHTLIEAANTAIDAVPRHTATRLAYDHTVGCAALCSDGRIFTGINVFHFSGGPCAENVALANAAAAGVSSAHSPGLSDAKITTIVAVANDKRGVISPCGRCRQMLMDYYPAIEVIVLDDAGELRLVEMKELLPFAYVNTKWANYDEREGLKNKEN